MVGVPPAAASPPAVDTHGDHLRRLPRDLRLLVRRDGARLGGPMSIDLYPACQCGHRKTEHQATPSSAVPSCRLCPCRRYQRRREDFPPDRCISCDAPTGSRWAVLCAHCELALEAT